MNFGCYRETLESLMGMASVGYTLAIHAKGRIHYIHKLDDDLYELTNRRLSDGNTSNGISATRQQIDDGDWQDIDQAPE